ncbi:UbiA family prenyltransferase [Geomesophilobacter sediminis]|uniref:UbiA family prenyltransferase n=1 Tax=Geomesophilobacter sediminis TaxID=2798584 RepID=A0A8J7M232_9BACT|nr:UbiA family prenyltransferase [Geomesophilobacter sediminis]MBJ6727298.1 UbiA family prenyltransferase [Geomesophilobacter sediminis]
MPHDSANHSVTASPPRPGKVADYLAIARLDHVTKQIFIVPGIVLAALLRGVHTEHLALNVFLGVVTAVGIASANYVINEWLDREFDKFHPTKSRRRAVQCELSGTVVAFEWFLLVATGLGAAFAAGRVTFLVAALFALQGLVYNVAPLRTKDQPYLDVVSESINSPLRLVIGWAMVDPLTIPPGSIILTYWMAGSFLMAAKRLSEYREIVAAHSKELLTRYRASFAGYTEISLTVSCFIYGLLSSFFLAVFLIKYRMEYILLMPVIIVMFAHYLSLSMKPGSSAQNPEKLYRERGLALLIILLVALFALTTAVDFPLLEQLTEQRFIGLR